MIKRSFLLLVLTFSTCALLGFRTNAQQFADKSYYLVDSLVLEDFSEQDTEILEKYLLEIHNTASDTSKVRAIYNLVTEMTNSSWSKYNGLQYRICVDKLKEKLTADEEQFYSIALSTAISNQAYIYDVEGKTDLAVEKYKESLNLSYRISDSLGIATAMNNLALSFDERGDFKTAIAYYKESLKIGQEINMIEERGIILNNLGGLYRDLGDIETALSYYREGLKLHNSLGSKREAVRIYCNMGSIYHDLKEYDKAYEYNSKAFEISEEIGYEEGKSRSSVGMGNYYAAKGQYSLAEKYYDSSLETNKRNNNKKGGINSKQCLGELYTQLERHEESQQILTEALTEAIASNYHLFVIELKIALSKEFLSSGDTESAMTHANESLSLSKEYGYTHKKRDALLQLSECYKSAEEYDKGLETYTQYLLLRDSLERLSPEKAALINETDSALNIEDKDKEKETPNYLIVGILGCVALLIIAGIIGYRIISKKNKKDQDVPSSEAVVTTKVSSTETSLDLTTLNSTLPDPISAREWDVLTELIKGSSNQKIADSLFISINTVKTHLLKIYTKLDVDNRTSAVQKLHELKSRSKI